jgi:hypothetical protein
MATPEMELNEDEARKFAGSLARVSSLYDDRINPKLVAWIDLVCVAGAIYGPRAIAISARMKTESTTRPAPVVINQPRQSAGKSSNAPGPRSPVEMFGDLFSGAAIPDAV